MAAYSTLHCLLKSSSLIYAPALSPKEHWAMLAPLSAAYRNARATASLDVWLPTHIWHDIIFTPSWFPVPPATLETPMPLLFTAATVPATWVPCPMSFLSVQVISPLLVTKLNPCISSMYPFPSSSFPAVPFSSASLVHMLSARSGWEYMTPSSMTATIMDGSPPVSLHASFTDTSAPSTAVLHLLVFPGLTRCHWSARPGSLNTAV